MKQILSDIESIKDKDKLITAYLSFRGLQKQHIDSFNYFIDQKLQQIVFSNLNRRITCDSDPSFLLEYTSIKVQNPTHVQSCDVSTRKSLLFPNECRLSDLTYAGDILVNAKIYMKDNEPYEVKDIKIGRMPIMLGSNKCNLIGKTEQQVYEVGECPYDPRGYFVVKGDEKVILIQEQLVDNRIIVDLNNKTNQLETQVQSYHLETKSKASILIKKNKFYVSSSSFKEAPLFIYFKAMGIQNEKEIIELIGTEPFIVEKLILSFEDLEKHQIVTQEDALKFLGKAIKNKYGPPAKDQSAIDQAREKLAQVFLAHVNCKKYDFHPRAVYLGLMVRRLLQAMEDNKLVDNRDYYGNKRMRCAGQMLELMFEDKFKLFNSMISTFLKKELGKFKGGKSVTSQDITNFMVQNGNVITDGLVNAIRTGKWQIQRFHMDRQGVSQLLARISFTSAMGMMTKMSSQLQKTRKVSGPRALLGSHFGMICPSDTPDGESCGLVKTLALLTHITHYDNEESVLNLLISLGVEDISHFKNHHNHFLVFLNGNIIGLTNTPEQLAYDIRTIRRHGKIDEFVSVYIDNKRKILCVNADSGRLVRPLIIVKDGIPQLTQKDLKDLQFNDPKTVFNQYVSRGKIEYLDVNESDNAQIALTPAFINQDTTHLEIDQMTILSCVTGLIPFPHHNQSPRNTYQCQMGKQSIGIIGSNQLMRCDTVLYLLIYPQTPLVRTVSMEAINQVNLPAGHNAQVAVMSYSCYDIEDALIVNKSSLDRGFGRTGVYRRYETSCETYTKDGQYKDIIVKIPSKGKQQHVPKRYHALDEDGITKVGAQLQYGDVFVNKLTPKVPVQAQKSIQNVPQNIEWIETPSVFKSQWNYTVDKVIITNENDTKNIKSILRQIRRPELGDKFSSRHGQKGVLGSIVNAEDMPFNEQGWCPDLIMNPHGYPSRMTVGKLIELLCGKLGALEGKFKYGTAFSGEKVEEVGAELLKRGFNFQGKDCLISGITGEYMECYVYQGPIFYQRLKHMVIDKIHARGRGPYQTLTRQPVEGRAKGGGQRLGEMERDCLLAYGASNLLLERLFVSSDPFKVYVCEKCGLFKSTKECSGCNSESVHQVTLPYACKLMFQELLSMNIKPKLQLVPIHERQDLTLLNKKFQALQQREREIDKHYDPVHVYKNQHPHIDDLRQDYQEDLENYGYTHLKAKQDQVEIVEESTPTQQRIMRPQTAFLSPQSRGSGSYLKRPITAPGFQMKVGNMMKIEELEEVQGVVQESKYWRNTKKYDKTNQNMVRNHSAMKKINLGTENEEYNIEEQDQSNKQFIERKIINNKLFSPTSAKFFSLSHQKSESDIKLLTQGFYEHFQLIKGKKPGQSPYAQSNLDINNSLAQVISSIGGVYNMSPIIVRTKSQGLRPQSAVQKYKGTQKTSMRPMSGKPQNFLVRGFGK